MKKKKATIVNALLLTHDHCWQPGEAVSLHARPFHSNARKIDIVLKGSIRNLENLLQRQCEGVASLLCPARFHILLQLPQRFLISEKDLKKM